MQIWNLVKVTYLFKLSPLFILLFSRKISNVKVCKMGKENSHNKQKISYFSFPGHIIILKRVLLIQMYHLAYMDCESNRTASTGIAHFKYICNYFLTCPKEGPRPQTNKLTKHLICSAFHSWLHRWLSAC